MDIENYALKLITYRKIHLLLLSWLREYKTVTEI